jgi:hypothetical protein
MEGRQRRIDKTCDLLLAEHLRQMQDPVAFCSTRRRNSHAIGRLLFDLFSWSGHSDAIPQFAPHGGVYRFVTFSPCQLTHTSNA